MHRTQKEIETAIANLESSSGGQWKLDDKGRLYTFISINAPAIYDRPYDGHAIGRTPEFKEFGYKLDDMHKSDSYHNSLTYSMECLGYADSNREDSGYYKFMLDINPHKELKDIGTDALKIGGVLKEYVSHYRDAALNRRLPENVLNAVIDQAALSINPKSGYNSLQP